MKFQSLKTVPFGCFTNREREQQFILNGGNMQASDSPNSVDKETKYKPGCHDHAAENYIRGVSGQKVHVYAPRPEEIILEDGVHALSHIPRFNGNTVKAYPVLAHLIWCYQIAAHRFPGWKSLQKACLFHDFHEAYIGDMASPIKQYQPCYRALERPHVVAHRIRFELSDGPAIADQVKQIDTKAFYVERYFLQDRTNYRIMTEFPRISLEIEASTLRDLIEMKPEDLRDMFHKIYSEEFCK